MEEMGRWMRVVVLLVIMVVLVQVVTRVKGASWSGMGESLQNEIEQIWGRVIKSSEPVAEPVASIQKQGEQLIEAVRGLPEDQLRAVRKQLYQELCENLLGE